MSLAQLTLLAVVLTVGVPSAWKNPTAGALVLCWVFSETLYLLTGDGMAVQFYAYPDVLVIAVIFAKREWCNLDSNGWLTELKCVLLERSPCDRLILLSYPVVWWLYVAPIAHYYQYWALWTISIAQFFAAGFEAFQKVMRARSAREKIDPPDNILLFPQQPAFAAAFQPYSHRRTAEAAQLVACGGYGDG